MIPTDFYSIEIGMYFLYDGVEWIKVDDETGIGEEGFEEYFQPHQEVFFIPDGE